MAVSPNWLSLSASASHCETMWKQGLIKRIVDAVPSSVIFLD